MKNRINLTVIGLLIAVVSYSCSNNDEKVITDIIPPVKLIAGVPDTVVISDLYYAADYNIKLNDNSYINTKLIDENSKIVFNAANNFEGITTVDFDYKDEKYSIPVICRKIENVQFTFKPKKKYDHINLFGTFNGWNRQNIPMEDKIGNGVYSISVPLEPGRYEYKFYCDGDELLDPQNNNIVPNGIGGQNSVIVVPDPRSEKIYLHKKEMKENDSNLLFTFYLDADKNYELNKSNIFALLDNDKIDDENIEINNDDISITLPAEELQNSKLVRVAVSINGLNSNIQMIPVNDIASLRKNKFNWYDGVIYSLMIDRFDDADKSNDLPIQQDSLSWKANYEGGDFAGVTQKINEGYFDSLGVNTIWLLPVVDNPNVAYREFPPPHRWFTGYHGYWPVSQNKVEEKFGTFKEMKTLVTAAHKHNIKILLDFVSHHVHELNPLYKEHRNWFGKLELPDGRLNLRLFDEERLTTWFEPYMPTFDFIHSDSAVNYMSDNAVWWLKETGADGFRHDAVKHVPNKFWRALTKKLKKEIEVPTGEDIYQIGETFGNYDLVSSYVNNGQLNAQFNFELFNTALSVFIDQKRSFKDLDAEMQKTFEVYGPLHLMGNIMDSHDKVRYMAYADGDVNLSGTDAVELGWTSPPKVDHPSSYKKGELYFAYMMSIPGIPVIYYGSEFGMSGAADPDNRRMMRFGDQLNGNEKNMLKVVSEITKLRDKHSALRYGDYFTLQSDNNLYAFIRSDFNERILIVLNKSDGPQEIELNLPEIYSVKKAVNLFDGKSVEVNNGKLKLVLNPIDWKYLKLE